MVKNLTQEPHDYPIKVGPNTRFPSIFRVHPQPGIKVDRDLGWVVEEVPFISVADLRAAKYTDPNDPKQKLAVYDLSFVDELKKANPKAKISPVPVADSDHTSFEEVYTGVSVTQEGLNYGEDGVYLQIVRTANEIYTVANGAHLIQHITNPFQKPGIKCRCACLHRTHNACSASGPSSLSSIS
jgi:hypothetical protein